MGMLEHWQNTVMGMLEHRMTAGNGNGLCGEGEWENTEWQPTSYRLNK
jgi:hypothetical protein